MIHGITETSFLDWDGKIVTVLYTAKCNFKCPFCHNWQLMEEPDRYPERDWKKIREYLEGHDDFIDGVCITGGEPLMEKGPEDLLREVKDMGMLVKLDTNGTIPEKLKDLIGKDLIDYIAMDVKMPLDERYSKAAGVEPDLEKLKESINLIMNSGLGYEFRTTVVPTIHEKEDVADIARLLKGAEKYVIQQFNPKNSWDPALREIRPYSNEEILEMADACAEYLEKVIIRGLR